MRPRFSLRQLLAFVVFVAVGCGALMAPWPWMASVVFTLTVSILGFGVLAAVGKTGRARFFWIGFAVIGWGYLWMVEADESGAGYPVSDRLITTKLLVLLWDARYPESPYAQHHGGGMGGMGGMGGGMFAVPAETSDLLSEADRLQREIANNPPLPSQANLALTPEDYDAMVPCFFQTGHAFLALFLAYLGGCLTRAFYDRRSGAPEGR